MNPADLAAVVHRELRQLPLPRAPETLLPRVLAAAQVWSRRPWYERAWFTWPVAWQVASVAALILVVAGGAMVIPGVAAGADHALSSLTAAVTDNTSKVVEGTKATAAAGRVLWRAIIEPLAPYALALVVLMCLACALLGTALNHLLSGRMLPR